MEPIVDIGILLSEKIEIILKGEYYQKELSEKISGELKLTYSKSYIKIVGIDKVFTELTFIPENYDLAVAEIKDVVIGIDFHWEQKQNQKFKGKLIVKIENEKLRLINHIPAEEYLKSVISSEMKASSHIELLKAHAVISRSWLFAQMERRKLGKLKDQTEFSEANESNELIKWYDSNDHTLFDVCADDHCQRYQGTTQISTQKAYDAVKETEGEVLMYNNELCDARFSKSCGGVSENFEYAWQNVHYPYLSKIIDYKKAPEAYNLELKVEENAEKWILNSPPAFCNTKDKEVLGQILNNYDLDTDFYRWEETLSQEKISALLLKKSGIDFGEIISLKALKRGESGRIYQLEIKGTKKTLVVGKELEIRRILSESHLFSSAFVVELMDLKDGIPQKFVFKGAGWGHGVGLCQIGAAVMANENYSYRQILSHYFLGAEIQKQY